MVNSYLLIHFLSLSTFSIAKSHISMAPPWSSGSVLDHRSLPHVFESRRGHIWRLFRLLLRLTTFGGRSAHLAYFVHKSGRKTSIIIIPHFYICPELPFNTKLLLKLFQLFLLVIYLYICDCMRRVLKRRSDKQCLKIFT